MPDEVLFDLLPKVASSFGAETAMTNLLWEMGERELLDDGDPRITAYGDSPLYVEILNRVRGFQAAELDKDGFDVDGIWRGGNVGLDVELDAICNVTDGEADEWDFLR